MWWTAALQAYQQQQAAKGGGASSGAGVLESRSAADVGITFDSSNWTVATGGSSAMGQRPAASGSDTVLYVGAGLVALVVIALIAYRR